MNREHNQEVEANTIYLQPCYNIFYIRSWTLLQDSIHWHRHSWRTKSTLRSMTFVQFLLFFRLNKKFCPQLQYIYLDWMKTISGGSNAFHSSYMTSMKAEERDSAGGQGDLLQLVSLESWDQHCAGSTWSFSARQLCSSKSGPSQILYQSLLQLWSLNVVLVSIDPKCKILHNCVEKVTLDHKYLLNIK